ncbi:MAG: hypothetical protein EBS49_09115 [Verrucomicrobia bacterium]|nr:hypothetical protein [Verrucomicrobiota bacterium]
MIIQRLKDKLNELMVRLDRKRIILDRQSEEPYLVRYYVFLKDRKRFPFNIFVHKFLKSDPDDVHDHPWPYFTLILRGGYWEWLPQFDKEGNKYGEVCVWRGPGHFRFSPAHSYHRIEVDPTVDCWTLFMPGPQRKEWGFLVENKWIPNEQYLEQRKLQNI